MKLRNLLISLILFVFFTSAWGEEHGSVSGSMSDTVYALTESISRAVDKQYYKASVTINRLLDIYKKQYGRQSAEYADCALWCAGKVAEYGDIKQADALLNLSSDIFRGQGTGVFAGRDSVQQILFFDVSALIAQGKGREYEQMRYMEQSVEMRRQVFGENNAVYLNGLLDLSRMYADRYRYGASQRTHNKGYLSYVTLIKREFASMSDSERQVYWEEASMYINKTINLAHNYARKYKYRHSSSLASATYNALLLSKGLLLNTTTGFETFVRNSSVDEAIALLGKKKLAIEKGGTTAEIDSFDYAIMRSLDAHGVSYKVEHLDITWQDVQSVLGDDDLAIEFYRTTSGEYGAVLLKHKWKCPRIVVLPDMCKIGNERMSLDKFLSENPFEHNKTDMLWEMSKLIWVDEIIKHFPKTDNGRVYFSADGRLLLTAVEYLPLFTTGQNTRQAEYTMSDAYSMCRLSSTRELVNSSDIIGTDAAIFGGLTYFMTPEEIEQDRIKYPSKKRSTPVFLSDTTVGRQLWEVLLPLEGTKREADSIVKLINVASHNEISAESYTGIHGTETAFKALDGKQKRILHIATHGFFNSQKAENGKQDAMLSSGLIMAGADRLFIEMDDNNYDDGILTAQEISVLDLRGMELVALSACETGLGEIGSDGVFGLQRGFKMASAGSILMSLWKVDDDATTYLMTEFYRNWLNGSNMHDALEKARQQVRMNPKWSSPHYWAAFILLDGK